MPRRWLGVNQAGSSAADIALCVAGKATSSSARSQSCGWPLQFFTGPAGLAAARLFSCVIRNATPTAAATIVAAARAGTLQLGAGGTPAFALAARERPPAGAGGGAIAAISSTTA